MNKDLFGEEDNDDESSDSDEGGKKGVKWGADVEDHHRKDGMNRMNSVASGKGSGGLITNNMN